MRPLAFEGRSFDDLFTVIDAPEPKSPSVGQHLGVSGVNGHRSLRVRASDELVNFVESNMQFGPDDFREGEIYFTAVMRDTGETLLTAQYNTILGGRWLALVPSDTIPGVGS